MRKPRDFNSELKALDGKARQLKRAKLQQLGQLDTSKNVLNFCIEACWVRRGSARRVMAV